MHIKQNGLNSIVKIILISITSMLSVVPTFGQELEVETINTPLNKLLAQWQENYNLNFSFDDDLLSQYHISVTQNFASPQEALREILTPLSLDFEKTGGVYVIFPLREKKKSETFQLIGQVVESENGEPLAYSHILANGIQTITDVSGVFVLTSKTDSVFDISISHLGCMRIDTILIARGRHQIKISPRVINISELNVNYYFVNDITTMGQNAGQINLNNYITNYLPGNGDNSTFNFLRMQPGVLAAGEQTNDFIIWGSPEGTGRVTFDGYTIWALSNFNANISAINPFMVKDINILKGGYDVDNDDVIGGLIKMNGKTGSSYRPSATVFINNQTVNVMAELPISKKISLIAAYRQSYRNLLSGEEIRYSKAITNTTDATTQLSEEYLFRDFNVKYSVKGDNGDLFFISILHGSDNLNTLSNINFPQYISSFNREEKNVQIGGSAFYNKTWTNGMNTNMRLSYSSLDNIYNRSYYMTRKQSNKTGAKAENVAISKVNEWGAEFKSTFRLGEHHSLNTGTKLTINNLLQTEDTVNVRYIDTSEELEQITLFVQDQWQLKNKTMIKAGLRYNSLANFSKSYIDPRLSVTVPVGHFKINLAYGNYHQFLVKSSTIDEDENYRYRWSVAGAGATPVLSSSHYVSDFTYHHNRLLLSACFFYKENDGMSRYIKQKKGKAIFIGNSYSKGMDLYLKQDIRNHSLWAAYSLSKTLEFFPYFKEQDYRRSPQDQRHELKLGGVFNYKKFHFSGSYVYGSGFPFYPNYVQSSYTESDYNRLDLAVNYQLPFDIVNGEIGFSILNIFNTENVKSSQFERIPMEQTNTIVITSEATPFTPLFYVKMKL